MAIPIIDFPDEVIEYRTASLVFDLVPRGVANQNAYTGNVDASQPFDLRWEAQFSLVASDERERLMIQTFADQVRGIWGPFRLFSTAQPLPIGTATGFGTGEDLTSRFWEDGTTWDDGTFAFEPGGTVGYVKEDAVKGAKQVTLEGMVADQVQSVAKGDLVAFEYERDNPQLTYLHRIQFDAPSDSTGTTHITIEPGLRESVNARTIADFEKPKSVFKFDGLPEIVIQPPLQASISFRAREWLEGLALPRAGGIRRAA